MQHHKQSNPNNQVSYGSFWSLIPFYVQQTTTKGIEMCVCKSHLHSRWATKALVANAKEQDIDLGEIVDYVSFHEYLIADWSKDEHAYISWKCTPSKDQVCEHVLAKWNQRQNLVVDNNTEVTVKMQQFKYEIYKLRKVKKLND